MYSVCGINAFKSTKSWSFIRLYNLAGRAGRLVVGWMTVLSKSSKSVRYWAIPFGLACTEAGLPGVTGLMTGYCCIVLDGCILRSGGCLVVTVADNCGCFLA